MGGKLSLCLNCKLSAFNEINTTMAWVCRIESTGRTVWFIIMKLFHLPGHGMYFVVAGVEIGLGVGAIYKPLPGFGRNNNNIDFYLAHNHESISMRCTIQISTQINIKIKHTCNIILKLKFIIYVIDKKQKTCIHECCP